MDKKTVLKSCVKRSCCEDGKGGCKKDGKGGCKDGKGGVMSSFPKGMPLKTPKMMPMPKMPTSMPLKDTVPAKKKKENILKKSVRKYA